MGKNKIQRFTENEQFSHLFQPEFNDVFKKDFTLKGKWSTDFFKNSNPIILELGCGKGEYTVDLSKNNSKKNYIGIDIKGARIWAGAKQIYDDKISNVAFIRTRIEFIESFFGKNEISEIWLTFSDPQPKKSKKKLSSSVFLNRYKNFLIDDGIINLKTDSDHLYEYTLNLALYNGLEVLVATNDLYNSIYVDDVLSIKTFYEKQFLLQGKTIKYLKFKLPSEKIIEEDPKEE